MCRHKIRSNLLLSILRNIYFAFAYRHVLCGIEIYANTSRIHIVHFFKNLITVNNTLLRILQNKPCKFPFWDLYLNFHTLAIPELHIYQLLQHDATPPWAREACSCSSYAVCFAKESQRCVDSDKMVLLNSSYTGLHRTLAGNPETSLYYLLPLA